MLPTRRKQLAYSLLLLFFSVLLIAIGFAAPVFGEMFISFEKALPKLTVATIYLANLWKLTGLGGFVVAVISVVSRQEKPNPPFRIQRLILVSAIILSLALVAFLLLPIFSLSSVVEDGA